MEFLRGLAQTEQDVTVMQDIPDIPGYNEQLILFGLLALLATASAIGVIGFKSPVRSALSLVVNFFTLALLYFTMNLHLIGISQILVYTGLIMMLFLFCILLLNLNAPTMLQERSAMKGWAAVLLAGGLVAAIFGQVVMPWVESGPPMAPDDFGTARSVGQSLFTNWVYPFLISAVLLLVGIVGSILLAKRRH